MIVKLIFSHQTYSITVKRAHFLEVGMFYLVDTFVSAQG